MLVLFGRERERERESRGGGGGGQKNRQTGRNREKGTKIKNGMITSYRLMYLSYNNVYCEFVTCTFEFLTQMSDTLICVIILVHLSIHTSACLVDSCGK